MGAVRGDRRLPADFRFIAQRSDINSRRGFDVWAVLPKLRETHPLRVFGRLARSVTVAQSEADLSTIAEQLAREHPRSNENRGVRVVALSTHIFRDVRAGLLALQAAVSIVLLIACANISNLLLTRAVDCRHEFAVRMALGASARRVYQQVLTEAGVLTLAGGGAGLLGGWAMLGVLKRVMPEMPRGDQIGIDLRVVAFTAGLSVLTALIFAAAPLVHQLRADANEVLRQGGRRTVAGSSRLRQFLTVAEIALAFVLVVGAGLIVQNLWRLMQVEPGFHSERVLAAKVSLSASRYRTPAAVADFHRRVLARVRTLPDVQSAGATAFLPLAGTDEHVGLSDRASAVAKDVGWLPAGDGGCHRVDAHSSHHRPNVHRRRLGGCAACRPHQRDAEAHLLCESGGRRQTPAPPRSHHGVAHHRRRRR